MPSKPTSIEKEETHTPISLTVVRKLAPRYAAVVAIYSPVYAIYTWLNGAGLWKISLEDFVFNIFSMVGVSVLVGATMAAIGAFFGMVISPLLFIVVGIACHVLRLEIKEDRLPDMATKISVWLFSILGFAGGGGWIFVMLASDSRDFTNAPSYDRMSWFFAVLGGAALAATYALFGKKLVDELNR